jgi:1,4-dihydroxy-2-naphthoate octaprenyltransferase
MRDQTAAIGRLTHWIRTARPRTLGASTVPVVVGTAAAGVARPWRTLGAVVVALGLQVGVNFANDYFDGVRGVDTEERLGPPRLTASGRVRPRAVLAVALASLAVGAAAGLALALVTSPALVLLVGAAALVAAILYSGGPAPYAGLGLGELMVFCFFGLMATVGTAYVQVESIPAAAWWAGSAMGSLAVAILVVNNLRDIPTDATAGKRTLAVRMGDRPTRWLYCTAVAAAYGIVVAGVAVAVAADASAGLPPWALLAFASLPLAISALRRARSAGGRALVPVLTATAATHAAFGLLLAAGLVLGGP